MAFEKTMGVFASAKTQALLCPCFFKRRLCRSNRSLAFFGASASVGALFYFYSVLCSGSPVQGELAAKWPTEGLLQQSLRLVPRHLPLHKGGCPHGNKSSKSANEVGFRGYIFKERNEKMPDFEKMYFELFNGVTDIIEELKALQQKAEKLYVDGASEDGK